MPAIIYYLLETRGVLYLTWSPFTIRIDSGRRWGPREQNGTLDLQRGSPIRGLVLLPVAEELIQPLCDSEVKEVNWILRLSAYS